MSRHRLGDAYADLDPDSFGRPAKRTRPRTKDRPDYSKAELGRVITVDRGRYRCQMAATGHMVSATKARQLGRKGVIVGDLVRVVGDTSGGEGTLARIVEVRPRATVLRRTADDNDPSERPLVANADQLMVVCALADPPPRTGMIDRILVAAYDASIEPIICLTKADLASPDEIIASYRPLDVPIVVTQPGSDLREVDELLADHVTVLVGHSGVGKSTLINRLVPDAGRVTAAVNETTGRGRHTSTSAIALELPTADGWVIDTPGVRSFGLSHVTPQSVLGAFGDLAEFTKGCPRGCTHTAGEPECGLDAAAADGLLDPGRLASFRRIIGAVSEPLAGESR
ncbi:ribosome small subunit-dependent GTPase A [Propionimicrobium sp. PCR01-08-3]|uniref:ribosome small subunit-dependent GTPase A n=1 Tax=Propionimicrobium sp. PCR01-08-3 TaxID=3052086 RepID=UPI00255CC7C2|nr:ribosome small subunit-dependent GTPase A [Propionimicrobium sp. PCR01-08-3]WIY83797.1 ribosome small subunit-dependent GTPase A [Propionimicrobium sp. PCR01-08-3]